MSGTHKNPFFARGRWYSRLGLGRAGARQAFQLATCATEADAQARHAVLVDVRDRLRSAGRLDIAPKLLEELAAARPGKSLAAVVKAVDLICRGESAPRPAMPASPTVEEVGRRWTSGELARTYPDHVKAKDSADDDAQRLRNYVYPIVGDVPIGGFTIEHGEKVLRALPETLSVATRRHVAQALRRLLELAVFPLRLLAANPLPRTFLPRLPPPKAKGWLYPDEDARLLACTTRPLCRRVFYGVMHREGPRFSEAAALDVADIDLERGVVRLDENKTDDPRAWALGPGVAAALRAWFAFRRAAGEVLGPDSPVFIDESGERLREGEHHAQRYRDDVRAAGVVRPELFEATATRLQLRLHDARGTFVTLALANGKTETWVADRTGHKSSVMINRYRRAARTAAELNLGPLLPLDQAIPEFAEGANSDANASGEAATEGVAGTADSSTISLGSPGRARTDTSRRTADFKSGALVKARAESSTSPENREDAPTNGDEPPSLLASPGGAVGVAIDAENPRAALIADLGEYVGRLTEAGDLAAARIASEALHRLLSSDGLVATVVPLAERRRGHRG